MRLTVNIGNSRVGIRLFENGAIAEGATMELARLESGESRAGLIREILSRAKRRPEDLKAGIIGSVHPALTADFQKTLVELFQREFLILDHETPLGFRNLYDDPSETGADRLANAAGARALAGAPVIVADAGTATTLDVVDANGNFAGGVILPGVSMALEAMHSGTRRLPEIEAGEVASVLGKSTADCMKAGAFLGSVFALEGLVRRAWEELGRETPALLTGGWAPAISRRLALAHKLEPQLTHRGLYEILKFNQTGS